MVKTERRLLSSAFAIALTAAAHLQALAQDSWTATPVAGAPEPRFSHSTVWTGREMIVWGGVNSDGVNNDHFNNGFRYDPILNAWTATSTAGAPTGRYVHTGVWTGREMIVWGGHNNTTSTYFNDGGRYDPALDSWSPMSAVGVPEGRWHHTATWTGREMVVWGGNVSYNFFNTGGRYDPRTDTWSATSTAGAPQGRYGHTATWTGRDMIVWGGFFNDAVTPAIFNGGGRYDPAGDTWTPITTLGAPEPRTDHVGVWSGRELIVWGGWDNVVTGLHYATGGRYDPQADSWTPTSMIEPPPARREAVAVWTGREMIVWGGYQQWIGVFASGGRYDPVADAWVATSLSGAPTSRMNHTAVWSGRDMIVWGGGSPPVGTGGLYRPPNWPEDTWAPTTTTGAPTARKWQSAIWTGREMIVWAGYDSAGAFTNTGARYDPITDAWTATSTTGAPAARYQHAAVWSGRDMIVWGGTDGSTPLGTGGRYDPVADAWSATSAAGAPEARMGHDAVWTGREMIVWGGMKIGPAAYLNSGGRYDPRTDAWTATSTAGAPSGREQHSMVWTGRHMIAWGGYDGAFFVNTGGRYDPKSDSWTPMSAASAPSGRMEQSAVWTGREMIVWGGWTDIVNPFNTGGRYDPLSDSWSATTTTSAPAERGRHTAVWTGREMIVHGGYKSPNPYPDGGRYDPVADAWTPITLANAPEARHLHSAVWTGREMIVWGGATPASPFNDTGGRYGLSAAAPADLGAADLSQHDSPGDPAQPPGYADNDGAVTLQATVTDPDGDMVAIQIEVVQVDTPLNGSGVPGTSVMGVYTGGFVASGSASLVTIPGLVDAQSYQWRARAMDIGGAVSAAWTDFGGNISNPPQVPADVDFKIVINLPPADVAAASLSQHDTPGGPAEAAGFVDDDASMTFRATVSDPNGGTVAVQIEVKPAGSPFNGTTSIYTGPFVASGGVSEITAAGLAEGAWQWRARATDGILASVSWTDFGANASNPPTDPADADFEIDNLPPGDVWTPTTTSGAPAGRYRHTAVWTGREMIVWGGFNGTFLDSGGRYDPVTDAWTATDTADPDAPGARRSHAAVWTGREMIVWGGEDASLNPVGDGARYDPVSDSWSPVSAAGAPAARLWHSAVWTGREMIAWGGSPVTDTGGRYDPRSDSWSPVTPSGAPAARARHIAVWTGSEMIVWGGFDAAPMNTGGRYDPATDSWAATTAAASPSARHLHTGVWTGREMIVWGGSDAGPTSSGGRYDPVSDAWVSIPAAGAPSPRRDHAAVWTGRDMIVWGGFNAAPLGDGGRYDPLLDVWMPTPPAFSPSARYYPTAVWTGREMIVWGGFDGAAALSDGGNYTPPTWPDDVWTPPAAAPLSARRLHTAVWTGREMIVWGGQGAAVFGDGARYDPVTDAWTAVSDAGAPSARTQHVAVWSGREMIVWGGLDGVALDTGGRYDPVTDSWNATAAAGAPSARYMHTAVWSGREMIVWAGYDAAATNTGGRYDPLLDAWTATSTAGAPTARVSHAVVWSGSRMIVWGGSDGALTNTGGAYDPVGDAWTATTTSGAPVARRWHGAVWTGREMIVWGGTPLTTAGGRYDPLSDSWTATTTTDAPSPRWGHTAIWTGQEVIVWGGRQVPATTYVATGGRYDPRTDSWAAMTTTSAAPKRAYHSAVWTGREMIVWGGFDGTFELDSGGRYGVGGSMPDLVPAPSLNQHDVSGGPAVPVGFIDDDNSMSFSGAVSDPDGGTVAIQVELKPAGTPFDGMTDVYTGSFVISGAVSEVTVSGLTNGPYQWRARATDGALPSASWTDFGAATDFEIAVNSPPTATSLNQHDLSGGPAVPVGFIDDDNSMSFSATVGDPDGGTVAIQVEVKPAGTPFDGVTDVYTGNFVASGAVSEVTVGGMANGPYQWRARATDGALPSVSWTDFGAATDFEIAANSPPTAASLNQHDVPGGPAVPVGFIDDDNSMSFSATVGDPDGGTVAIQVEIKPAGTPFDGVTNVYTGNFVASGAVSEVTVSGLTNGPYQWRARATDGALPSVIWTDFGAATDFEIAVNSPPAAASLNQHDVPGGPAVPVGFIDDDSSMSFSATVSDPDGGTVAIQVEVKPAGTPFDGVTDVYTGGFVASGGVSEVTVGGMANGPYQWRARATDGALPSAGWTEFGAATDFEIAVNFPPDDPTGLGQWKLDGTTAIVLGGTTDEAGAVFKALVSDPNGGVVSLEVEVKTVGTAFDGTATQLGPAVGSGTEATVTVAGLADDSYHWRARGVDPVGAAGNWMSFGGNPESDVDFVVANAAVNVPPDDPSGLQQRMLDGATPIAPGGVTPENGVVLEGLVSDADATAVTLEVEVKPFGVPFDGIASAQAAGPSGSVVQVTVIGLADGPYLWRARTVDPSGAASAWVAFGGAVDFIVAMPVNSPPDAPAGLGQWKTDGVTSIAVGGSTSETGMIARAVLTDPDGDDVRLEVEIRPLGVAFADVATQVGPMIASGGMADVVCMGLVAGQAYHWQARAVDVNAVACAWVGFAANLESEADVIVTANQAPADPTGLAQWKSNGATAIAVGGETNETEVVLEAAAADANGDGVWLEFELREVAQAFDGQATMTAGPAPAGTLVRVKAAGLSAGARYHWRVRGRDGVGAAGPWTSFGGNSDPETDFSVAQQRRDGSGRGSSCSFFLLSSRGSAGPGMLWVALALAAVARALARTTR